MTNYNSGIEGLLEALFRFDPVTVCNTCKHYYTKTGFNDYCCKCKGCAPRGIDWKWSPLRKNDSGNEQPR